MHQLASFRNIIVTICNKLGYCKRWNALTLTFKKEEAFYNELTEKIQLEMSRHNVANLYDMFKIINTTENTLFELLKMQNSTNNKTLQNKDHFQRTDREYKKRKDIETDKFREFHNKNPQNTDECRGYKRKMNTKRIKHIL